MRFAFITGNRGKFREVSDALNNLDIEIEMLSLDPPEIQADDLSAVAEFSLRYLVEIGKLECNDEAMEIDGKRYRAAFLEDAGLFISDLAGFPGVYSSYVFKTLGNEGILRLMRDPDQREAEFRAVIAAVFPGGSGAEIKSYAGGCQGLISTKARGSNGFGYDPVFIPQGEDRTFGEMSVGEKAEYSHRAKALAKFIEDINRV